MFAQCGSSAGPMMLPVHPKRIYKRTSIGFVWSLILKMIIEVYGPQREIDTAMIHNALENRLISWLIGHHLQDFVRKRRTFEFLLERRMNFPGMEVRRRPFRAIPVCEEGRARIHLANKYRYGMRNPDVKARVLSRLKRALD